MGRRAFLTVGTTEFDQLLSAIDSIDFLFSLKAGGFTTLVIQMGRGIYEPKIIRGECHKVGIEVAVYRFKPTLDEDMENADLIISHCGAGSILEAVKNKKPLIVVVNETLQGNHQMELSDALTKQGHCISTTPNTLIDALNSRAVASNEMSDERHCEFPINDSSAFCTAIESMFVFQS